MNINGYVYNRETHIWRRAEAKPFAYSDGDDVEASLYESLLQAEDVSVHSDELRRLQSDWPSTYHVSEKRSNLLRPLEKTLLHGASILEIGCGCGAITRYLGEVEARQVVAVEGSLRRAAITALRCRDLNNVYVVADNFFDLPHEIGSFDAVTLIGVLEYARVFGGDHNAEEQLLRRAYSFLRPGGVLILAIENKLGLKYLAGVPEDHLGSSWRGVMNCYTDSGVRTWSRHELESLLKKVGFSEISQFVPIPDYKLPITIIHPYALETDEKEFRCAPLLAMHSRSYEEKPFFNHLQAWSSVCQAGLLADLADSLCFTSIKSPVSSSPWLENVLVSHYSSPLAKSLAKEMTIEKTARENIMVRRRLLFPELTAGDDNQIYQKMSDEQYIYGDLLIEKMREAMIIPGWRAPKLAELIRPWIDWLTTKKIPGTDLLPFHYIDAGPINTFITKDKAIIAFDFEWFSSSPLPFWSAVTRSLSAALIKIGPVAQPGTDTPLKFWPLLSEILSNFGQLDGPQALKNYFREAMVLDNFLGGQESGEYYEKSLDAFQLPVIIDRKTYASMASELASIKISRTYLWAKRASRFWQVCRMLFKYVDKPLP